MGSRYGGDARSSAGNLAYRDSPPPRWDADRFTREQEIRYSGPPPLERERPYDGYGRRMEERFASPPPRAAPPPRFEEKYFEEERYGPPSRRVDRKYYEEDEIYSPRSPVGGQMVPFRPTRPAEVPPPPRPGIIRRQSSLDTFDRQPTRRFEEYTRGPPPPRFREPEPPRAPRFPEPRYAEREYDDQNYKYKEREWVSFRHRDDSPPSSHGGDPREEGREEVREELREEEVIEEFGEREKPFPRRGKTRMPRRLVNTRILNDLRYPYHEEGDVIVIELALGKENIDDVVALSKRMVEETTTVHLIEAPPGPPPPPEIREERFVEKIETMNIHDAPRSVREWDHLSVRSPSPSAKSHKSHKSHRSRSRRSRRGSSPSEKPEKIIDVHSDIVTVREVSPARTAKSGKSRKSHKSRRRSPSSSSSSSSSSSRTRVVERREIIEMDQEESSSVHISPLALVVSPDRERRKSRSDRDIKAQIRELEEERKALERERKDRDVVRVRRGTIVRDVDEDVVEVKKDKKAPSAGMMRAMLATLT